MNSKRRFDIIMGTICLVEGVVNYVTKPNGLVPMIVFVVTAAVYMLFYIYDGRKK